MRKELISFSKKYFKAIKDENAAIFAGAGMSVSTGFVNWKGLLSEIASELELDIDKENDLISLAQYYENEKGGRGSINSKLIEEFTKNTIISENHKILSSLPIKTYWTTNYDDLIEKAIENSGKTVDVKRCTENLAINIPKRDAIIYKMHGDISLPHDAVITKDDYENYNEKRQLFTTSLQGDLVSKTFLFIGFSFEDPNLEYILSRIRILLGNNRREHYCFFKSVKRIDFETEDDYNYAFVKQNLKIKDLKRYSIQALSIDDYSEITDTLKTIKTKIIRQNIFISGAAHDYGDFGKDRAEKFVYNLATNLSKKGYKVISGFGLGIGSLVINGVLSYVYSDKYRHLDDYLILRPFPQNISEPDERKKLWKKYREGIIDNSGIVLFLFGNKQVEDKIVDSDGLLEEFEIAIKQDVKIIPIGCTGFVAKSIWDKVINDIDVYYKDNQSLKDSIKLLGDNSLNDTEILNNIMKSISLLQEEQ